MSTPQNSNVRRRQKQRRTKQLTEWRAKQEAAAQSSFPDAKRQERAVKYQ
ncbi:hypothetical protein [Pajaroellobacter abortibovis]|nr:hypothetical protein [Pajaroellobacter abortibovis]